MQVQWLHPWLLVGMLGAVVPIIIHLIGRRNARIVSFAAFDFLLVVAKRLARRERLRQFLLLLLRVLAIVALVIALGRPMPLRVLSTVLVQKKVILVLDASASMAYKVDGLSLLELAKTKVIEIISHLQPDDGVSLIIAGEEMKIPFNAPTIEHSALRRELDKIDKPSGVADLGLAIEKGLSQLEGDGTGAKIIVVSDLSVNSFEGLRATKIDPLPEIRLVDVLGREKLQALPNLAIESLKVEPSTLSPLDRVFRITIRNYGASPIDRLPIELLIADRVKQRGYIDVAGRGVVEKAMTVSFEEPGVYQGKIRLFDDGSGLAVDNEIFFVVEAAKGVRVLAVNGDPRVTPYQDELFFLERALEILPAGEAPIQLNIVTQEELESVEVQRWLNDWVDVVVLANNSGFSPTALQTLENFVKRGGGVFITLGSQSSFEKLNEELMAILPHPLRDFHQAYDPVSDSPPLGIGELDWKHPIFRGLGLSFDQSIRASRTRGYFNLATGATGETRTLLKFDNGAPALVERVGDGGRVLLLTTSIDLDHSDLVLRTGFLALLQRGCRYLAKGALEVSGKQVQIGEPIEIPAPMGLSKVALISPGGIRSENVVRRDSKRLKWAPTDEIGIYRVEVFRKEWERMPRLDLAVNPSLVESDYQPINPAQVAASLSGTESEAFVSLTSSGGANGQPYEARGFASYFLLTMCLLFVGESLLASRG